MVYGTPFEQLEDEEKTAITKRPKGIQDEIVTDERGKRRFHGAFTGGFSAGYFNTVGTKHGWVPQTFKSTREERADKLDQTAVDFMDEEDLGEFGIAARKLRTKVDFMDSLAAPGEKRLLAWERSTTTSTATVPSTSAAATTNDDGSLAFTLTGMLRPVNDSIGVRMLKKMGWRPGKGVGAKMSRRALERQKVIDAKSAGKRANFDEEAVKEVEEQVPEAEFSPDDVSMLGIKQKDDVHGLGYKPLQDRGVLSEKYGTVASALKTSQRSKGIRGQAFGVGAFEEDDEDIYTNYDLSQYDFEVGASTASARNNVPKFDSTFVPASASSIASRKYFTAPMPPSGWRPNPNRTKSLLERKPAHKLPETVLKVSERLTPFQRAKLLGERDHSVMEMLTMVDRERLRQFGGKKGEGKRMTEEVEERGGGWGREGKRRREAEPFEEEPMKAHRFKQYVGYLKRGIPFPQPVDMTRLEWEKEQNQFQDALTPELRALLPEVRDRQKPLAKIDYAAPIAEHLKSRFERETGVDVKYEPSSASKDPKFEAVRTKQFGALTRQKHEWHPAKDLCKRFNVTNPYPDSQIVGTPGVSRTSQSNYAAEYSLMDFGGGALKDTASELAKRHHPSRFDQRGAGGGAEKPQKDVKREMAEEVQVVEEERKGELAPMELLAAIFGDEEDEEEPVENEEEEEEEEALIRLPRKQQPAGGSTEPTTTTTNGKPAAEGEGGSRRFVTVFDLVEDDNVYGPAMPSKEFLVEERNGKEEEEEREAIQVVTVEDESEEEGEGGGSNSSDEEDEPRKKRRKERRRKEKKHHHKSKKAKKEKKKRKRRTSESSSTGSD